MASEKARLSGKLAETAIAFDKAQSQIELMKKMLSAGEAERSKLAAAVKDSNKQHQTETDALNARLEAMTERAINAEKLLAAARQRLLGRIADNFNAERKLADTVVAREAVEEELARLQTSLEMKDRQVQELEQMRAQLIEGAKTLLESLKARDAALAQAEERNKFLVEAARTTTQIKLEECNSQPQAERVERTPSEGGRKKARADRTVLKRELENDEWLFTGNLAFLSAA
jgi:crescentin